MELRGVLGQLTYKHCAPSGAKSDGRSPRVIISNGQVIAIQKKTTGEQNQAIEYDESSGFNPYCDNLSVPCCWVRIRSCRSPHSVHAVSADYFPVIPSIWRYAANRIITIASITVIRQESAVLSRSNGSSASLYQIWQLAQSPFQQKSPIEMVLIERNWKHRSNRFFSGTSNFLPSNSMVTSRSNGS